MFLKIIWAVKLSPKKTKQKKKDKSETKINSAYQTNIRTQFYNGKIKEEWHEDKKN